MAYSFSQRTHEVGIRIALGAQRADILRMALSEGMRIVAIGLATGLVRRRDNDAIFPLHAFQRSASRPNHLPNCFRDPGRVALFACYIPAQRATQVDPLAALREE